MRVLRYLPTNLSAPEIARELSVSVTTVRTHISHLFGKLGAHRRTEAVARARDLGLLAPSPMRRAGQPRATVLCGHAGAGGPSRYVGAFRPAGAGLRVTSVGITVGGSVLEVYGRAKQGIACEVRLTIP
jgi:DNA-binding CsgD family transcriptional regulator